MTVLSFLSSTRAARRIGSACARQCHRGIHNRCCFTKMLPEKADVMDGFYAWVHPDHGWSSDGHDWGEGYLNYCYSKMSSRYRDKLGVGAGWAGLDDK